MLDIVFEKNKYFAIENNDKIIYTYPHNIKFSNMNKSKQCSYRLEYGFDNFEELSFNLLRIDPNKPFLNSLHLLDDNDICFQILDQDASIRGDFSMPIFIGKGKYDNICIYSVFCPDINSSNIYIRGINIERDEIKIRKKIDPARVGIIMKILDDLNNRSIHQVFLDSLSGIYKEF